ncbi:hypothetical protein L2K70_13895 [Nocardioides KLBMP 9356]|uniref:MFS transporter n=1 Tax=Nocardioides potassii TaxID=2911371 RepID=A0ABS9HC31_9ACTN|nr:hypothetical protein [Nocardioides potassii]MCF6378701.1 hypothetical protein [Nocardioides potassii]
METGARVVRTRAPHVLARAVAATVVVVVSALAAHTWAGGTVPTGPGLTLVAAVVLAGGVLLFTREVPLWAVLPLVAAAQLGLHESFGLVAQHTHEPGMSGMAPAADAGWTWQMVGAHLFVTLLTAFLWWVGRRAALYVVALLLAAAPPVAPRLRPRPADVRLGTSLVHLVVPPGRGPPGGVQPT